MKFDAVNSNTFQDQANQRSDHDGGYRPCSLATAATLSLRGLSQAEHQKGDSCCQNCERFHDATSGWPAAG